MSPQFRPAATRTPPTRDEYPPTGELDTIQWQSVTSGQLHSSRQDRLSVNPVTTFARPIELAASTELLERSWEDR
jgi:hypothetical protein